MSATPSTGPSDAELIAACRRGRTECFGDLVERHQHRAYTLAFRLTGDADEASDLVQEAFLKAFRALDRFQGRSAFYTWLFRIVVNEARSRRRFQTVRPTTRSLDAVRRAEDASEETPLQRLAAATPDPVETAAASERKALVEDALARLDPDQREMIVLRDLEGRDYAEIADALECPKGTVKSRLHRARQALKDILTPVLASDSEAAL